jgi:hypothetical protein
MWSRGLVFAFVSINVWRNFIICQTIDVKRNLAHKQWCKLFLLQKKKTTNKRKFPVYRRAKSCFFSKNLLSNLL